MNIPSNFTSQRLFAVVHLFGKQFKVTKGDLLMVDNDIPLKCGQSLIINKCLVVGGKDFSIIGRPVVDKDLIKIDAMVVEKTMTDHTCKYESKSRNHGIRKFFWQSLPRTVLRITDIELKKIPDCKELFT